MVVKTLLFLSQQAWNDAASSAGLEYALDAAERISTDDPAYREYGLTMAASYAVQLGDAAKGQRLLDESPASDRDDILARRLGTAATVAWLLGDADTAQNAAQRARDAALRAGDPDLLVRVHSSRADLFAVLGKSGNSLEHWQLAFNAAQTGGFIGTELTMRAQCPTRLVRSQPLRLRNLCSCLPPSMVALGTQTRTQHDLEMGRMV